MLTTRERATNELLVYEIRSMKNEVTPYVTGNKVSFHVAITSEGAFSEDWLKTGNVLKAERLLKTIEKSIEKEVETLVNKSLKAVQKEYKVDVLGFGNVVRIHHPKLWEKVKNDWDQRFCKASIKDDVKINIRDFGTKGSKK